MAHRETETTNTQSTEGSGLYLHPSLALLPVPVLQVVGPSSTAQPVPDCEFRKPRSRVQEQGPESPEANPRNQSLLAPAYPPLDWALTHRRRSASRWRLGSRIPAELQKDKQESRGAKNRGDSATVVEQLPPTVSFGGKSEPRTDRWNLPGLCKCHPRPRNPAAENLPGLQGHRDPTSERPKQPPARYPGH